MPIDDAANHIDLDNPDFQAVLTLIEETDNSVFLTGKAGTGKSTFLRYLTANCPKKFVVLAPTGIAAVNVGGQTLHSFFKLPFLPFLPEDPDFSEKRLRKRLRYSKSQIELIKSIELIIIDEISMVRADTIDFIDRILRVFTGNKRDPFGGKQLLLVGDVFQLEPVVTSEVRQVLQRHYTAPYFFNADAFGRVALVSVELRKVYRQDNDEFIAMLDRIRQGHATEVDIATINRRISADIDDERNDSFTMTIATRRDMVDNINSSHLDALDAPEMTFEGKVTGEFPENAYPTDLNLTLKEGAHVIFIKNDKERRWVNGTIGRVVKATEDEIRVMVEDGETYTVDVETWSNLRYGYDEETKRVTQEELGAFMQYPLKLAWAITIHKSQGLTFKNVIIDVGTGAFTGGQSYVALSRCKSLEGITMRSTINQRDVFVSPVIRRFSQGFNDKALYDSVIASARTKRLLKMAARYFDMDDPVRSLDALWQAAAQSPDLLTNEALRRFVTKSVRQYVVDKSREVTKAESDRQKIERRLKDLEESYIREAADCRESGWDLSAAVEIYDRALRVNPDSQQALLGKASALSDMGDADEAIALLDSACRRWPDDWEAPLAMGRLFKSLGDNTNALDRLLVALDREDECAEIHQALAEVYETLDDRRSAKRHLSALKRLRSKPG